MPHFEEAGQIGVCCACHFFRNKMRRNVIVIVCLSCGGRRRAGYYFVPVVPIFFLYSFSDFQGGDNVPKTVSTSVFSKVPIEFSKVLTVFSKVLTVFSKVLTVFSKVLTVFLPDFTEEAGGDGFAFFFRFRVREWAKCPFLDTSCFRK